MICKQIQELLKSDYLDAEATADQRQRIEEHLHACQYCRALAEELRKQRALFQKMVRHEVPEAVWQNIRAAIIKERAAREHSVFAGVREWCEGLFRIPRPAFALASVFAALILVAALVVFPFGRQQPSGLTNGADVYGGGIQNGDLLYDFGTAIEEYFL